VVPGDTNGLQDVFVVDLETEAVVRASVSTGGAQGNDDSPIGQGERPALSHDGTWVAFSTLSTNLGATPGTTGIGNMLMHNRLTGQTRTVTNQNAGSVGQPSMSRNGTYVAFGSSFELDPRFPHTGLFVRYTGVANAWFWNP
jgi:Tol biopolymer transport system component